MQTRYRFIHFEPYCQGSDHTEWSCCNNKTGDTLGFVRWYGPWRKNVFEPTEGVIFDRSCLADIASFLAAIDADRGGA